MSCDKVDVKKVNWKDLLKTKTLIMWYKSSGTFLRNNENDLKKIEKIITIVPDFQNKSLMEDYVKYYPTQYKDIEEIQTSISKTVDLVLNLNGVVYLHNGIIHYPCYKTDSHYIVGLHEFGKIKTITSPCFISENDDFIEEQVKLLLENSKIYKKN
jgi:hypothetical protein